MATTIDSTGFTRDRLDVILANVDAAMRSIYGADIDLTPSSADGQFDGVLSEAMDTLGQLAEDVHLARSVAGARGESLSRQVQLIGIRRNVASYSTAAVVHSGTPGTVIPDGSLIDNTDAPPAHFQTVGAVTIEAGGTVPGVVRATTTGPVFAAAGTITAIKTVISGWASVTNAAAVNLGSLQETDAALRVRRAASVAINSKSIVDGIYAALANIQGVTEAVVFENRTGSPISRVGSTDLPPNAIQSVVRGGLDADIAAAIWAKASGGVTLVGATTYAILDSQGVSQVIRWDRPIDMAIYATVFLRLNAGVVITDATKAAVAKAMVDFGNTSAGIGKRIIWAECFAPVSAIMRNVPGATAGEIYLGTLPTVGSGPGEQNRSDVVVPFTSVATWDVGRVSVQPVVVYTS